jgi:hypothetical protein
VHPEDRLWGGFSAKGLYMEKKMRPKTFKGGTFMEKRMWFAVMLILTTVFTISCKQSEEFKFLENDDGDNNPIGKEAIIFTPDNHDFGAVEAYDGQKGKVIEVKNNTSQTVYLQELTGTNDHFTLVTHTCPEAPQPFLAQATCQATISFTPQLPGMQAVTIEARYGLTSDASDLESTTRLTGTGVSPIEFDGVQAIDNISHTKMRLNWIANDDATSFIIFRIQTGSMIYVDTVSNPSGTISSYTVTNLMPGTSYTFRVRAVDILGNQESNEKDETASTTANQEPTLQPEGNPTTYSGLTLANIDINDVNGSDKDDDGDFITYECLFDNNIDGIMDMTSQDCTAIENEGGGNPSFNTQQGIFSSWTPRHADANKMFEFRITGSDIYGASSNIIFSTTVNPGVPDPPVLSSINPASPANFNTPTVTGTTGAFFTIKLYSDPACNNEITVAPTAADADGDFAVDANVPDNLPTTIYGTATNIIGNESACSASSQTFFEDSSPPNPLLVTSTTPLSPSSLTTLTVNGQTEPNVAIEIFSDSGCNTSEGTGTSAPDGSFSVTVNAPIGTTDFYAEATDSAGNTSPCSTGFVSYEAYEIATGVAWMSGDETMAPASPSNVNQFPGANMKWSLGYYDSNYYSYSTATDPDRLYVGQDGDYLIAATLPLKLTSVVLYRAAVRMEVFVNGSPVPGGIGESTYIRLSNHDESSAHVSVLASNLTAGNYIEVFLEMTSTDASVVEITGQASMYVEYIEPARNIFAATSVETTAGASFNRNADDPMIWLETENAAGFIHDDLSNPENITLVDGGDYLVFVNVPLQSNGTRVSPKIQVQVGNSTVDGGEGQQGYIRNDTGHNNSSIHWFGMIFDAPAMSTFNVKTRAASTATTSTTVPAGKEASLYIEKLDTSSNVIFTRATQLSGGDNWNPANEETILWVNDDVIDNAVYRHDTADEIEFRVDGDYLVVYNDNIYCDAADRQSPNMRLLVDGAPQPGAQAKSHYVRRSGHSYASGALVYFLKGMTAGQKVSIDVKAESSAGLCDDATDAILMIQKKD